MDINDANEKIFLSCGYCDFKKQVKISSIAKIANIGNWSSDMDKAFKAIKAHMKRKHKNYE